MNELEKRLKKIGLYSVEELTKDAVEYCNAIKEHRMVCVIHSVSSSGMNRNLSFMSCEKSNTPDRYYYRNYFQLFLALGHKRAKRDGFIVNGCGMDMIFSTNYNIIKDLIYYNIISADLDYLSQETPTNLS